jgi:Ca2+-binding EF-hand superfamily protein
MIFFRIALVLLLTSLSFVAISAEKTEAEKRAEIFKTVDTDNSGGVSKAELDKADPNLLKRIRKNFDDMDANKDGEVTLSERDAYVEKQGSK